MPYYRKSILVIREKDIAVHKCISINTKNKKVRLFVLFVLFLSEGYPNENSKFTENDL